MSWIAGCGTEPEDPKKHQAGFSLATQKSRTDLIAYAPENPEGLIIAFHGLTETAQKMADYSQLQGVAEATNHMLVYLNAGGTTHWKRKVDSRHVAQVIELWNRLQAEHDLKSLYLIGFSDGAIFSHFLANGELLPVNGIIAYAGGIGVFRKNRVTLKDSKYRVLVLQNRNDKINRPKYSDEMYAEYLQADYDVTLLNHGWGAKRLGHWWDQAFNQDIYDFIRE
jgi:poly(3-hydroxybutyrate) depolymerase